ncbi:hypothetical protein UT300009_30010 [Paraclostridium bifermentans]
MKKEEFQEIVKRAEEIVDALDEVAQKSIEFARWMKEKQLKEDDFTKEQLEQIDKISDKADNLVDDLFTI